MTRIGSYALHAVETGTFGLDGGAMFGVVPKPLWEKRIEPDARNRIPLAMRCLLLESEDRLILIDNGLGDKYSDRFAQLYAVDHESATLAGSLASLGFTPRDVTDVILTHLHFDHAGGSTFRVGDRLDVLFANARHHVQRAHWESALRPNPREAPSFLDENLTPLAESGQLVFHDGDTTLFDGVSVSTVNGHTDAMQIVKIQDDRKTLVYVADLLPTSHHLAPAWTMAYDVRPLVTMNEKEVFLREAVAGRWALFFEHDPFVAVADVEEAERGLSAVRQRSLEDL
jgi:glyoxylase-like metal-dependent hydrolase (beta-lactamase superfamily II)